MGFFFVAEYITDSYVLRDLTFLSKQAALDYCQKHNLVKEHYVILEAHGTGV